jgi:lysophospholipase
VNNFTSVQSILDTTPDVSGSLWQFGNSIFEGPATGGLQVLDSVQYYTTIADQVVGKSAAGYDTSITDYWGRALSFQLINATDGGPGYTWSSIANDPDFSSGNAPFPIVVADERAPGQLDIPSNTTVIEFNPFEMGSFDPTLYGFVPTEYVGANYSGGVLPGSESCVRGYDSASFVLGTSSSLFNEFMLGLGNSTAVPSVLKDPLMSVLSEFSDSNEDIAEWSPNPFYGWNNASNPSATNRSLTLVDGGEDNQNIPLNPLIQPLRAVDVIFAIDASADTTYNWPNGSALRATYERSLSAIENGTAFPAIPDDNTFINLGLNAKPTFFGCNASNQTGPTPLIVYIPNAPLSYFTNLSTFDPSYNNSQRNSIIENGFNVATRGNGTLDSQWPTCVGCAMLSRSLERTGTDVPEVCQQCFTEYCWNGTLDTTPANYAPSVTVLNSNGSTGAGKKGAAAGQVVPMVFAVLLAGLVSAVVF